MLYARIQTESCVIALATSLEADLRRLSPERPPRLRQGRRLMGAFSVHGNARTAWRRRRTGLIVATLGLAGLAAVAGAWLTLSTAAPASDLDSEPAAATDTASGTVVASSRWVRVTTGEGNGSAAAIHYRDLANRPVFLPAADDETTTQR
jgi:hypothetical protein